MPRTPRSFFQKGQQKLRLDGYAVLGRGLAAALLTYLLLVGGTFNGLLLTEWQRLSLVGLTAGALLGLGWAWRNGGPASTALDGALLAWAAAYALSAVAHPDGRTMIGVWWAGLYGGLWLLVSDLRARGMPAWWLTDAALMAMFPVLLLALWQGAAWFPRWAKADLRVAFEPPRPSATLGNPNLLGAAIALLCPYALSRLRGARGGERGLWTLWCVLATLALLRTLSRGAWLGTSAALLTLFTLSNGAQKARFRRWLWPLLGALTLGSVIAALVIFRSPGRAPALRWHFAEAAWRAFRAAPLTGQGPFSFGRSLAAAQSIPPAQPHAHAHNLALNVAAELGLLGLGALALTAALIVRHGWRALQTERDPRARTHRAASAAALAAIATHSLVDMPLILPAVMLLTLIALLGWLPRPTRENAPLRTAVVALLWAAVLGGGWWWTGVYGRYVQGQRQLAQGNYHAATETLEQVARAAPTLPIRQAAYGYACGLAAVHGERACLAEGIRAYRRALRQEPQQALWWANLAALYELAGQDAEALAAMQRAAQAAPDAPDLWLNLGRLYEAQGQPTQAKAAYGHALELGPAWGLTRFWEASPLRKAVRAAHTDAPHGYARVEVLWRGGDPLGALAELETIRTYDPTEPKPYIYRARIAIRGGDLAEAQRNLAAAALLTRTEYAQAWLRVAEAELAAAASDPQRCATLWQEARALLWSTKTGWPTPYGQDVARLQFLHDRVAGVLLPTLTVYGPDPQLTELLLSATFCE